MSAINIQASPEVVNVRGSIVGEKSVIEDKLNNTELSKKDKADLEKLKSTLDSIDTLVRDTVNTFDDSDNATLNVQGDIQHDSISLTIILSIARYNRTDFNS